MNKLTRIVLGVSLAVTLSSIAMAQDKAPSGPPKILQITREFTKPGKGGAAHDKSESVFVQAMAKAKWPTHYIGFNALSGKSRADFFVPYDSFEAMEKDNAAIGKNATLSAVLDKAGVADGDLLDSVDQAVFTYDEDLSYKPSQDVSNMRFLEVSTYHVRPGHGAEWDDVVKIVKDGHAKAGTTAHWDMYELAYGGDGGTYMVLSPMHSLSEVDRGFAEDKQFDAAVGKEGLKKLNEEFGAAVDTTDHQLLAVNPHMSYVSDEWVKAYPDFWKTKAPAPAAKPATAPAKPTP